MNRKNGTSVKGKECGICEKSESFGTWVMSPAYFAQHSPVPLFPLSPYVDASPARLAFQACRARGVA